MSSLLIIILLFLLQFFYLPVGTSFFEGTKVYLAEALIALLVLRAVLSKEGMQIKKYKKGFLWAAGVLIVVGIYHLVFQPSSTVLFGNAFRQQGTFLLWMLILFSFVSSRISIEEKIKPIFITVVLFVQLVCTLLFMGVGADRPVGTFGEPNALAANIIFLWPFILFTWPKKLPLQVLAGAGLLFALIILFLSGSRSGIIALAVQMSFLGIVWIGKMLFHASNNKQKALKYGLFATIVILLLTYTTPFIGPRTEYEDRGEIWKAAVHAGINHPALGVGFGNAEYELHKANVTLNNKLPGYYVDSAHNIFLDWFIQAGLVGLGVLLFFIYQAFKTFLQQKQTRYIVLLLGIITVLSFNPASVVSLIAFWWLIGKGAT